MSFFGKVGSFFKHVGHDIAHGAEVVGHGIVHGAEVVGHGIVHGAEDAARAVAKAIQAGGKILGRVEDIVGAPLRFVVGGVAHAIGDLIGIHMRSLTKDEKDLLRPVFQHTLPLDKILITSISGKDGRAFTIPGSMVVSLSALIPVVGHVLALAGLIEHLQDRFLINVGGDAYKRLIPSAYDGKQGEKAGSLLVHESTHVWQGYNAAFSWWYVFNSLYNQARCGSHAYDVDESHRKQWTGYGVEQQATVVERWFSRGSKTTDDLFPYVQDNIRKGKPFGRTSSL
jgi:hypothetical protein